VPDPELTPVLRSGGAPGDLGRRVRRRRESLGLDGRELASRAAAHPAYLEYLETQPGRPSWETVERLARALDTTAEELLGARPSEVDGGPLPYGPAAGTRLEVLSPNECWALLVPRGVARVVVPGDRPALRVVDYATADGLLAFSVPATGVVAGAAQSVRHLLMEVDHLDEVSREGWSVVVEGPARVLESSDLLQQAWPWPRQEGALLVGTAPVSLTGRRLAPR